MTRSDDRTATDPNKVDAIKLSLMLADLRLPTINQLWKSFAKRADAEGWTAARFLAALAEHELAERDRRRIERHLREARLLPGTRNCAGTMSRRSLRSSPIRSISPQPHGQSVLSRSITRSIRGRCSGRWPILRTAAGRFGDGAGDGSAGAIAASSSAAAATRPTGRSPGVRR